MEQYFDSKLEFNAFLNFQRRDIVCIDSISVYVYTLIYS